MVPARGQELQIKSLVHILGVHTGVGPIDVVGDATVTVERPSEKVRKEIVGHIHASNRQRFARADSNADHPVVKEPVAECQAEYPTRGETSGVARDSVGQPEDPREQLKVLNIVRNKADVSAVWREIPIRNEDTNRISEFRPPDPAMFRAPGLHSRAPPLEG